MRIGQQRQSDVVADGFRDTAVTDVFFHRFVGNADVYRQIAVLFLVKVDSQAHIVQDLFDYSLDVFVRQNVFFGGTHSIVDDLAQRRYERYQQFVGHHQRKALRIQVNYRFHKLADRIDLFQIHIDDRVGAADGRVGRRRAAVFGVVGRISGIAADRSVVVEFGNYEYLFHYGSDSRVQIQIVQAEEQLRIEQLDAGIGDVVRQSYSDQILTHILFRSRAGVIYYRITDNQIHGERPGDLRHILRVQQPVQIDADVHGNFAYQRFVASGEDDTCIETFRRLQTQHTEQDLQQFGNVEVAVLQIDRQPDIGAGSQRYLREVCVRFPVLYRNHGIEGAGFAHFFRHGGMYVFDVGFEGLSEDADAESQSRVVFGSFYLSVLAYDGVAVVVIDVPFLGRRIQIDAYLIFGIGSHTYGSRRTDDVPYIFA